MAGNIIGVIAQRLVRKLCIFCREEYVPDPALRQLLGLHENETPKLYRATGCKKCDQQGYKGRMAIMELLKIDEDIDDLIAKRATAREMTQTALAKDFVPLADDAIRRVREGVTSLEEVSRVVDLTHRVKPNIS
jgi:type IV pilus assembly protein PilB